MNEIDNGRFWLAEFLYDNDKFFINADNIISVRPIMDDDAIAGYRVLTVDDETYEVKFKTGPFSYHYEVMKAMNKPDVAFHR